MEVKKTKKVMCYTCLDSIAMSHLKNCYDCDFGRALDLQHSLIQQTRDTKTEVLAVVKERIITTQPCTITEEIQEGGTCSGMFGFNKTIKVVFFFF